MMDELDIALPDDLHRAGREDSALLGAITADAFRDDPVNDWIFGNETAMRQTFRSLARRVYTPRGYACLAGTDAAAMWLGPGASKELPLYALPGLAASLLATGGPRALMRALAADTALAAHKPKAPHIYLFTIAVRRGRQGQGLGRRLILPTLAACDRAQRPAYLENSNPANDGFYRSLGFESIGEILIAPDAPPLEAMWREPR
ncbi:GNAT family N-acetyltransferase [Maricaulis salignorans]|uniref:Acetyltransferase (GNAT) family protein n=1 Tax=Maricaulis salignorans TaxID=144026 RepID=A0A1G9TTQ7_9PROT|nr:GNAT family N-acetyltransferase [Maricaulis salignorans]SDM51123.1 Acetyltransferase (GNAT) family protein [Maricaulis salignorans]